MVITLADPRKWNPQPSVEKGKKQRVYITESHKHRTWWWYLVGERIEQKSDLEVPEIMQAGEYFGKKKKGHIKEQISRSPPTTEPVGSCPSNHEGDWFTLQRGYGVPALKGTKHREGWWNSC